MANNDNITYGSAFDDSAKRGLGSQPDLPVVSFMYHLDCTARCSGHWWRKNQNSDFFFSCFFSAFLSFAHFGFTSHYVCGVNPWPP